MYSQYKNSDKLVKIRSVFSNGHIEEEYFPKPADFSTTADTLEDFGKNYYEKTQSMENSYLNRLQYAEEITIYPDSTKKILTENRGYCIVLFSSTE